LLTQKVDLAQKIMETKLLPTDWVYENIFHLSEDQYDEYRDLIVEDQKRVFRNTQISGEGNDPKMTGKSYGTPHDLASLYGVGRMESNPANVPAGYNEKVPLGRPKEKASNINTQNSNFGKDKLGRDGMKKDYNDTKKTTLKPNPKGGSALALETKNMLKKAPRPPKTEKQLVFEGKNKENGLLDESQLES